MVISSSSPTVLIAVANPLTGHYFEQTLRCCFEVVLVPEADRTLRIMREMTPVHPGPPLLGEAPDHPVDLLIIEYGDTISAAADLLRQIKSTREFRTIPVILATEEDVPADELQALELGAADFWGLPMTDTVLLARVALHTQRARSTRNLIRYSMADPSTGAASRRLFENSLRTEWLRSVRDKAWMSLAFIAMDGYETYAERLGQESVEECMQMLAEALKVCLRRPGDMLSRISEDMFAALLPATGPQGAPVVTQQMLHSVSGLQLAFPGNVARLQLDEHVSVSVGTASATPESPKGFEDFAKSAYSALGLAMAEGPWGMRQHHSTEPDDESGGNPSDP